MDEGTSLEGLPPEVFEAILAYILRPRERSLLSLLSRRLRNKVAPHLYSSWRYYGGGHSFKSLYCFLRTVILHPDLASHVQTLDLREWRIFMRRQDPAKESEYDINFFQEVIRSLDFEKDWTARFDKSIQERSEDILLALLLTRLPNLQTMFMTMPEQANSIHNMIGLLSNPQRPRILKHLKSIYICGALHVGIKGHRKYDLPVEDILAFFRLRSLESLVTLTASPFIGYSQHNHKLIEGELLRSSNLSELAFDAAMLNIDDIVRVLLIPKALKCFRWSQSISCYSIGSCNHPVFRELGVALTAHKDTLEDLDLDIRQRLCAGKGHAGNPDANVEDMLYQFSARRGSNPHLVGPLGDFKELKSLAIDPAALWGDKKWGPAPYQMAHTLPASLEVLRLRFEFRDPGPQRIEQLQKHVWINGLAELAMAMGSKLPKLRKIAVIMINHWWSGEEDNILFGEVKEACVGAGVVFQVLETKADTPMTPVPYFQKQGAKRRPGRDW